MRENVILHSDANCFYASVEMLLNPALRGKAVAVCGCVENRHGIVLAKSEAAKRAGVKTGQANWEAKQACPDLITVEPQYDEYIRFSRLLQNIYRDYTDRLEPFGMDECWLDVTGIVHKYRSGKNIAEEIRNRVKEELGITVSVGVSFNKIFAKLGSDMKKPDAVTVLDDSAWKEKIFPLQVSELLYCGRATTKKLARRGVYTVGDLAQLPEDMVRSWFGVNGVALWRSARGEDHSLVAPDGYEPVVKSVGHGITCVRDLEQSEDIWKVLLELSQDVGHRLRLHELAAKGIRLGVRCSDLRGEQYQTQLMSATQSPLEIARAAQNLFEKRFYWRESVRALTVAAIDLAQKDDPIQTDMFGDAERLEKRKNLEDCVEKIRSRFGYTSIRPAVLLSGLPMPEDGRDKVRMPSRAFTQ